MKNTKQDIRTSPFRGRSLLATLSWVAAIAFATISLLLPPRGHIDSSVLVLVAQLLVLVATFLGVDSYVNVMKRDALSEK